MKLVKVYWGDGNVFPKSGICYAGKNKKCYDKTRFRVLCKHYQAPATMWLGSFSGYTEIKCSAPTTKGKKP